MLPVGISTAIVYREGSLVETKGTRFNHSLTSSLSGITWLRCLKRLRSRRSWSGKRELRKGVTIFLALHLRFIIQSGSAAGSSLDGHR